MVNSVFSRRRAQRWSLALVIGLCLGAASSSATGFYFGVRGDYTHKKVGESTKLFLKNAKDNVGGVTVFSGCSYSAFGCSVAGQVYFGGRRQAEPEEKTVDGVTYKCQLWNRWNTGAEILLGKSMSILTAFGIVGVQCSMVQLRGYKVDGTTPREISFYGKKAKSFDGVSFEKLQPPRNYVLTPTLGAGLRLNIQTAFVGLEVRHAFTNDRKIHVKVTKASGNSIVSTAQKADEKHKIGGTTFSLAAGLHM